MLNVSLSTTLRRGAVVALLTAIAAAAHADGVSAAVSVGAPLTLSPAVYRTGGPVGVVNVGYRGGHGGGYGGRGGRYYGGYYGGYPGGWCCGWGVGLGAGLLLASPWVYPGPTTVIVEQPPQVYAAPPAPAPAAAPSRPEPVIYPRNGQSAQQLEADRQECNRWATTQPAALNDSSVFMRAVDACMDARGYTSK